MSANQRRHPRIAHEAIVNVISSRHSTIQRQMRDFSESGTFLLCDKNLFSPNDKVSIQTTEIEDAPIVFSRVVRVERNTGFAVEFLN
jgi:hypothetical protein